MNKQVKLGLMCKHPLWEYATKWLSQDEIDECIEHAINNTHDVFGLFDSFVADICEIIADAEFYCRHEADKRYHNSIPREDMLDILGYMLYTTKGRIKSIKLDNGYEYTPYDIKEIWEIEEVSESDIYSVYQCERRLMDSWIRP